MIYVLYGQPASGKTTLGGLLADQLDTPFVIDGDELRSMFDGIPHDRPKESGYDRSGREKNIRNANAIATYLNKKTQSVGHVVMGLVNPYKHLRNELKLNNADQVSEVLLVSTRELRREYHVEDFEEGDPDYVLNTDEEPKYTWSNLKDLLNL